MCKCCPIPTIRTRNSEQTKGWGPYLHWREHRLLTVQDARRAQSWPDDELIIGTPSQKYAIVGNGVDRAVSYSLGKSLLQSVLQSMKPHRLGTDDQVAAQHTSGRTETRTDRTQTTTSSFATGVDMSNPLPTPSPTPDFESNFELDHDPKTPDTLEDEKSTSNLIVESIEPTTIFARRKRTIPGKKERHEFIATGTNPNHRPSAIARRSRSTSCIPYTQRASSIVAKIRKKRRTSRREVAALGECNTLPRRARLPQETLLETPLDLTQRLPESSNSVTSASKPSTDKTPTSPGNIVANTESSKRRRVSAREMTALRALNERSALSLKTANARRAPLATLVDNRPGRNHTVKHRVSKRRKTPMHKAFDEAQLNMLRNQAATSLIRASFRMGQHTFNIRSDSTYGAR